MSFSFPPGRRGRRARAQKAVSRAAQAAKVATAVKAVASFVEDRAGDKAKSKKAKSAPKRSLKRPALIAGLAGLGIAAKLKARRASSAPDFPVAGATPTPPPNVVPDPTEGGAPAEPASPSSGDDGDNREQSAAGPVDAAEADVVSSGDGQGTKS